jgi:hypothetical protein
VAAGYGLLMALVTSGAFALGLFRLDVMGMGAVVVAHCVWYVLVGLVMWRSTDIPKLAQAGPRIT